MSGFNMKYTPKDKEEITKFKNFYEFDNVSFSQFDGKIIYMNTSQYAGKHIYEPYFVVGDTAKALIFETDLLEVKRPLFTLQDLSYDDIIVYFSVESWKRKIDQIKNKKP
jgi:hypothetical protein